MSSKPLLPSLAKYLGFTLLGAALVMVASFVQALREDVPPPPLQGLPNQVDLIGPEFQSRLEANFPIGTTEERLIAGLSQWGFKFVESEQGLWADLEVRSFGCTDGFSVEWNTDEQGVVSELQGHFHLSCL